MKPKLFFCILICLAICCLGCNSENNQPATDEQNELPIIEEEQNFISGLKYDNIVISLEEHFGITEEAGRKVVPESLNSYSYYIEVNENLNVTDMGFLINYGKLQPIEKFYDDVIEYLCFCASFPYDTANPEAAQTFIVESISSAVNADFKEDFQVSKVFGDARYVLEGYCTGEQFRYFVLWFFVN